MIYVTLRFKKKCFWSRVEAGKSLGRKETRLGVDNYSHKENRSFDCTNSHAFSILG